MRRHTVLSILFFLLLSSPVLAQKADDMDSTSQTRGYGVLFGGVLAVVAVGVVLLVGIHIIKGMIAEAARGKKGRLIEDVLDDKDMPKQKKRVLYLGEKVPDWKVGKRRKATLAGLKLLARADENFSPKAVSVAALKAFEAVKAAIESRSVKTIEKKVTTDVLEDLRSQIQKLRKKGELHVFAPVEVSEVGIVHFEAPKSREKHTFTALIAAKSRDYFADEKSGEVLRGDKKSYIYQEFWTFRRSADRWLVSRIRPAGDMDTVLAAKNVMAQGDLDKFAKEADEAVLLEFVGK
jgi:Tim44-like domain